VHGPPAGGPIPGRFPAVSATGVPIEEDVMKLRPRVVLVAALLAATAASNAQQPSAEKAWREPGQSWQASRASADQALQQLYSLEPRARKEFGESVAYAVFDVDAGGNGNGIAVETSIREETLMGVQGSRPASPGGYRQVWLFRTGRAYRLFVANGHEFADGTRLTPHMVRGTQWPPGALDVDDDTVLYHITADGLAREVTMPASAYRRNAAFDRNTRS
jgi:hypothetical protein